MPNYLEMMPPLAITHTHTHTHAERGADTLPTNPHTNMPDCLIVNGNSEKETSYQKLLLKLDLTA